MKNVENFNKLCDRSKKLVLDLLSSGETRYIECLSKSANCGFDYTKCKSPMEELYWLAFNIVRFDPSIYEDENGDLFYLKPQHKIEINRNVYYADFLVCELADEKMTETNLIIEIDGHDFHEKTKEQVKRDKERELELKMAGYDILRFSGSQVYQQPCNCAFKTINYYIGTRW